MCPAEGGTTLDAFARAAAKAFAMGDGTATAWAKAFAAAIAQYGCDSIKPVLAGKSLAACPCAIEWTVKHGYLFTKSG